MFDESLNESTELTACTVRKIRNLVEFLKAIDVKEHVIFYIITQISEFISLDPDLAVTFVKDEYPAGDWKLLWGELLSRVEVYNTALLEGKF